MLSLLFCLLLSAADNSDWNRLKELSAGERIGVIHANHQRTEAKLVAVSDTGITLSTATLSRDEVVRVYRAGGLSRGKRVLIGAGIGLAAGIVLDRTAGTRFRNETSDTAGAKSALWIGLGAGAGAGIGAASGGGYQTLYRRAPHK